MKESTREKLRQAAIKNNLGGYNPVLRKCNQCECDFYGTPNQLRCKDCIELGYPKKCNHCNKDYVSSRKDGKYCKICFKNKLWLKGKKRPKEIGEKVSKSKKKWYQTEEGKKFAKKIGKLNSKNMKEFYKTSKGINQKEKNAKLHSKRMKEKIKNGEFTPFISNSFTHWDAKIYLENGEVKKFRSSWEACFWYSNQHLQYEKLRIPYTAKNGEKKVYIADFTSPDGDTLYEIKPKKYFMKQKHKMDSIIQYCIDNNIKFIWINEYNILSYIDKFIFEGSENKTQLNKLLKGVK